MTTHWSVAQIFSKRAHLIRAEVEGKGFGTFTPTYARKWVSNGKVSAGERSLLPGYLIFQTGSEDWGGVGSTEGVIRVLGADGRAGRVRDDEMYRLVLGHATGEHNEIANTSAEPVERRRRRRPRRSKRLRMRAERAMGA